MSADEAEKKRILIMEDSDIFADMLIGFLETSNYTIERAVNGFEGIKKVYSFLPHLVITDVEMPLFKGYQVTRLLKSRKNTKTIPVIMFTTLDETKDKFWGTQTGADSYIEKSPDNFEVLGKEVEKILLQDYDIDFDAIKKESSKINDDSIIEIVNNLLDNKLFQTTVIGLLTELAGKVHSIELVIEGIFELLHTICEAEIITLLVRSSGTKLFYYTANSGGFSREISDNFIEISVNDFNKMFPGEKFVNKYIKNFNEAGTNEKKLSSYVNIPLAIAGENFACLHIANTINDYFSPSIMENINVFSAAASPIIANALAMHELSELQKNTRTAFARYVPADVMDEIINETASKTRMSDNRKITVLFSDVRNFTNISENSEAQSVVDFLNSYFSKMGNEIISQGGHIDKFIGDAIMAVFGAFQKLENSPVNAVAAAIKMLAALEEINKTRNTNARSKINIGIGINCGECIMGNIGFQNKMDYTVIGDTVNLASRVESLTKFYRHPLIVTEYVYEAVKDSFLIRKIDNVRVKGKDKPVGIFAVYSHFHGADGNKLRSGDVIDIPCVSSLMVNRDALINFNKGLQVFYMREWKLAEEYFIKSLNADGSDFLSQLYLERSLEYMRNPPADDWDGIVTLQGK